MIEPKIKPFTFFDGESGIKYTVTDIINDGQIGFSIDQDELAIIRWHNDGGADPEEQKRRFEPEEVEVKSNPFTRVANGLPPY